MGILIRRSAILDRLLPSDIFFTVVVGLAGCVCMNFCCRFSFFSLGGAAHIECVRECVCFTLPLRFCFVLVHFISIVCWLNELCVPVWVCVYVFVYLDLLFVVGFSRCMFVLFLLLMYSNNHHITSPLSSSDTSTSTIELVWSKLYVFVQWLREYWS